MKNIIFELLEQFANKIFCIFSSRIKNFTESIVDKSSVYFKAVDTLRKHNKRVAYTNIEDAF